MQAIRVIVVDDQQLVRDGIASLLDLQDTISVVATAENGQECLDMEREYEPDVILMDIRMPIMDGITATEELRSTGSPARVLMLTTFDDEEYIMKSLLAGAYGYLMKDLPIENLVNAIVQVRSCTFQIAPGVMDTLITSFNEAKSRQIKVDHESDQLWTNLNEREQTVLSHLGKGMTNREIAAEIGLSEGTVKNYVSDILATLDLRDRTQAALMAARNGWSS